MPDAMFSRAAFSRALEDGGWHHVNSYAPERAQRPSTVALWHKITTVEDPVWTERYHAPGQDKAFGGQVIVTIGIKPTEPNTGTSVAVNVPMIRPEVALVISMVPLPPSVLHAPVGVPGGLATIMVRDGPLRA